MKSEMFDHDTTVCTNKSPMGCAAHRQAAFDRLIKDFGRVEAEYLGWPIVALRAEIARLAQPLPVGAVA